MKSHGDEISIAGYVEDMVYDPNPMRLFFFFFFFFFIMCLVLTTYGDKDYVLR